MAHFVFYSGTDKVETSEGFELMILPSVVPSSEDVENYDDMLTKLYEKWAKYEEQARRNEEGRIASENSRGSAEAARVEAENDRLSSEAVRKKAEAARASAENERAAAEAGRKGAEAKRVEAEGARGAAEEAREGTEAGRSEAETARTEAEAARELRQAKNDADQAANNAAAQGLQVVKLSDGEYDPSTLAPTVDGQVGRLYFVPIPSDAMGALMSVLGQKGEPGNSYLEWMWIDGAWERVGMSNATLVSLTTDEIDRIVAGEQVTSEGVLDGTGASYLVKSARTAIDAELSDKATKSELKAVQDSLSRSLLASIAAGSSRRITDLKSIDTRNPGGGANAPGVAAVEDASALVNSPVKSGAFYAYRLVMPIESQGAGRWHFLVLLLEFWPLAGRVWAAAWNCDRGNWQQEWTAVARG